MLLQSPGGDEDNISCRCRHNFQRKRVADLHTHCKKMNALEYCITGRTVPTTAFKWRPFPNLVELAFYCMESPRFLMPRGSLS